MQKEKKTSLRIERFTIEYPKTPAERKRWNKEYGTNAIYAGKHWSRRNADKEFWHSMVRASMHRAEIPRKFFDKPVDIVMKWNDGLDIDNHSYMGKMLVDSLTGWLIQNDSRRYVRSVKHEFHNEDYILVEVSEVRNG